ncbi:MAG: hypothetical protein LBU51_08390 [Bacteroidales bacterium]|jgi:hypothetical protein|nr:hypothetical protein [Bacteroidales bacterium]
MATTNSNTNDRGILDIINGDKALQFSISIDMLSITYLIAGAMVAGILLILFSKKVVK